MKVYHRSSTTDEAGSSPVTDAPGGATAAGSVVGVWVSTARPVRRSAEPPGVVELEIPDTLFERYEWARGDRPYRAALIPAPVLSRYSSRRRARGQPVEPEEPISPESPVTPETQIEPQAPRRRGMRRALAVGVAIVAAMLLVRAVKRRRRL